MKIIIAVLLSVAIYSCGMSKSEKDNIQAMINFHNVKAHTRFFEDSLNEIERKHIEIYHLSKQIDISRHLKIHGDTFESKWNNPYEISKDYNLTFDKYVEYCKANNKDPKTFYKFMD